VIKVGWTSKDLRDDLKELKKMYKSETDPDKKEEIISAIHTVMYNICDIEMGDDSLADISDSMLLFNSVPKFTMYYPVVYKFLNVLNATSYDPLEHVQFKTDKEEIKKEEIFPMMHDFYKSLGKEVFKYFSEVDNTRDKSVNLIEDIDAVEGVTYSVPVLNKRYMVVGTFGDLRDTLSTLTHEYGHGIATVINPNRYSSDDFFIEIESLFFELLGLDYYYNMTNDTFYSDCLKDKVTTYYWNANNVTAMKRVSDKTFMNMNDGLSSRKLCKRYLKIEGFDDDKLTIDVDDKMKYLFSYIVAVELFETFKEDKELAINLLERMVNREKNVSEFNSIFDNVVPVKSLNKHLERITRY
jgi:hypothetical protein